MKLTFLVLLFLFNISFSLKLYSAVSSGDRQPKSNNSLSGVLDVLKRIENKYIALESNKLEVQVTPDTYVNQLVPFSSVNSNQSKSGIPSGEELILSVYIEQKYLADVFGSKTDNGALISVTSLFEVLDFPIQVDLINNIAKGWFISEDKTFKFKFDDDSGIATVNVNGYVSDVSPDLFSIEQNDLLIDGQLISKWFALNLNYSFRALQIDLKPTNPLPVQMRLARKNKRINSNQKRESTLPWKESRYQMISSPLANVQIQNSSNNRSNSVSNSTFVSVLGSHDFAFMNSEYYVGGQIGEGLSSARLKFTEKLKPGVFGFLPAGVVEVGDIRPVAINSNYNSVINRGFSFSKTSSEISNNQRININGDIQPGWDLELYHNNILLAKQTSVQTGRYEFNNIELLFGNNNFEIISYGPQGQVDKEVREVFIDSNALLTSENNYALSVVQVGKSLLGVDNEIEGSEGVLLSGTFSRGITDWFSLSLGQSTLLSDVGGNESTSSLGANFSLFERLLISAETSINHNDDISSRFTGRSGMLGQSWFYSFFKENSSSQEIEGVTQHKKDTRHLLTVGGQLLNFSSYRLNYKNLFSYRNSPSGIETTSASNQLSLSAGRFSIQHSLDWSKQEEALNSNQIMSGSLQTVRQIGPVYTRFSVNYSIRPESQVDSINTSLSWSMFKKLQSNFTFDYFPKVDKYRAGLNLNWLTDNFTLSSNFNYDDEQYWTFGLSLRLGLGYDMDNNKLFMSARPLTSSGVMSVRVFEDENNDGVFNFGEKVIEGAKVKAPQSARQAISGSDGIAIIENLPVEIKTDIEIDTSSLGDPFLIPSSKGVSITPRKAFLDSVEYPVVTSSEIDGTVYAYNETGVERNLAYVPVHLLNKNGDIVQTTQSEYDGYYLFVDLIPGEYFVSLDKTYLKLHKLENVQDLEIDLSVQGDVLSGSDFSIRELDFTKGYVVKVGEFADLSMLKVYWHLIQRRYRARLRQSAFYVENDGSKKYSLNLAFYVDKTEASQACEKVLETDIQCGVEAYEFVSH